MTPKACIIDTNVIVSGLIGADSNSPPARILDAMLDGDLLYLMSDDLLNEYSSVLRRPRLVRPHGRTDDEIDRLLTDRADKKTRKNRPGKSETGKHPSMM